LHPIEVSSYVRNYTKSGESCRLEHELKRKIYFQPNNIRPAAVMRKNVKMGPEGREDNKNSYSALPPGHYHNCQVWIPVDSNTSNSHLLDPKTSFYHS